MSSLHRNEPLAMKIRLKKKIRMTVVTILDPDLLHRLHRFGRKGHLLRQKRVLTRARVLDGALDAQFWTMRSAPPMPTGPPNSRRS